MTAADEPPVPPLPAGMVEIPVRYASLQCFGDNGLAPEPVVHGLVAAGIQASLGKIEKHAVPTCEACIAGCSVHFAYVVRVSAAQEQEARRVLATMERKLRDGPGQTPPPP